MWTNVPVYLQDLEHIIHDNNIPWDALDGKTILVTGATGLIGSNVVNALLYYGLHSVNPPKVLALVRNEEKAENMFHAQRKECEAFFEFVCADVCAPIKIAPKVDYIIHAASETASKAFVEQPVETVETAITGTKNILNIAKEKQVRSFVYLSSMEVYGYPQKGDEVTENMVAGFETTNVRNCYPISKQMCENLCCAYNREYGVPVKIVRLTQTFGPGVQFDDKRVFAEFMRCVRDNRNIILKTEGKTERSYLYTSDAVSAILTVMLKGQDCEAYTAANRETYCSILEMAELIARRFTENRIRVEFELQNIAKLGYADTLYMNLSTDKLEALGWKANVDLENMYRRTLQVFG